MKKLILLFAILLPCLVFAQEIKEEQKSKSFEYMCFSFSASRLHLSINEGYLTNEDRKTIIFTNPALMMSYFGKDGWELVTVDSSVYFFKKDVTGWPDEKIKEFLGKYNITNKLRY
ncbi:MAG: hypothetical protein PHD17_01300 [Methanothrix soehngenii]|jgi:hypothetical protein|nr:hypothetical protein [Methanothrix soehngenii]NLB77984.1 hypothetical protein [Clostridiaceae bacterium]